MPRASANSKRGLADRAADLDPQSQPDQVWVFANETNLRRYTKLIVCAFCGVVKTGSSLSWRQVLPFPAGEPSPYVVTNPALQEKTKCGAKWWQCPYCAKAKHSLQRAHWLPYYADEYLTALYSLHPLQGMLLSFLDISANFANRCKSFLRGGFQPSSILDCTYLTWNFAKIQTLFTSTLPDAMTDC